jgi:hypothetical protein
MVMGTRLQTSEVTHLLKLIETKLGSIAFILFSVFSCVTTENAKIPGHLVKSETIFLDWEKISALRHSIGTESNRGLKRVLEKSVKNNIECGPYSVMSKKDLPASGNRHDYMSLAPYYWPNPRTSDHLPYVRRDGETNPESEQVGDEQVLFAMTNCSYRLAIAGFLLGDQRALVKSGDLIRTWFVSPATRMTPHLKYANARRRHRGSENGRALGIEVGRVLLKVIDTVQILKASGNLHPDDANALTGWFFLEYLDRQKLMESTASDEQLFAHIGSLDPPD